MSRSVKKRWTLFGALAGSTATLARARLVPSALVVILGAGAGAGAAASTAAPQNTSPPTITGSFIHHPIVVWAAALFLFLILLAWGPTAGDRQLLGVVILAATTAVAIEALRRQTQRESPGDPHPAVGKAPGAT